MEIYKLTSADWKQYRDIRSEAVMKDTEAFAESYEQASKRTDEEWKEKMGTTTSHIFVARDGEEIIGMAAAFQEQGERVNHIAYMWGVYLREAYRGQGIGKKMMQALISEVQQNKEIKKINLNVNTKQKSAVKAYKSLGFQVAGTLHMELKINGEYFDEYVMEKIF